MLQGDLVVSYKSSQNGFVGRESQLDVWKHPSQVVFPFGIVAVGTVKHGFSTSDVHVEHQVNVQLPQPQQLGQRMWIGGANELVVDENFFVAVTQECVRDREQRVNYRNLLIALLVVEFAVLIANGLQLKANFSKEMAVWAWIVVTIVRFVCFGGAMIRIKNESRSGSLLLFGASLTFSLVVFGLLFNHSSEGILLVIVHVLITLVAHLLKSVMSPLWFCPTFA